MVYIIRNYIYNKELSGSTKVLSLNNSTRYRDSFTTHWKSNASSSANGDMQGVARKYGGGSKFVLDTHIFLPPPVCNVLMTPVPEVCYVAMAGGSSHFLHWQPFA